MIEIRIIGLEKVLPFPLMIFFAINSSKFNLGTTLVGHKSMNLQFRIFRLFNTLFAFCILCTVTFGQSMAVEMQLGNAQFQEYLPLIKDGNIGLVANQSSRIGNEHLVDELLKKGIHIKVIFSPEHGFRGKADAGELVENGKDKKTNLPIISLYGGNKKPKAEQLKGIDIILFDIQDVGVRFYTYISTLHYVMEAAAEQNIKVIVLDRPNPNGYYVDGPILEKKYKSFVGMHPVPVVHGMTIGEYAMMINGESWLKNGLRCDLDIIKVKGYTHNSRYSLPIAPSPNLPNDRSINLYPSLCFFEGTPISVGRGTDRPFQQFGHPNLKLYSYVFTPTSMPGAKNPKLKGQNCYGRNLSDYKELDALDLSFLIQVYQQFDEKDDFFTSFFNLLAGNKSLVNQIEQGLSSSEIKSSWTEGLESFKAIRKKYLLYPDFD